jgi:hypothetical protein
MGLKPLPITQFSKEAHYCKRCERKRVKEYTASKRARATRAARNPGQN